MYLCTKDWVLNGRTLCKKGHRYAIKFLSGDNEGYCDITGENGEVIESNCVDVGEFFSGT